MARTKSDQEIKSMRAEIKTIIAEHEYYSISLSMDKDAPSFSYTHVATSSTETDDKPLVQIQRPAVVKPHEMAQIWNRVGEYWMVVNQPLHLSIFMWAGGNALIETSIAQDKLGRVLKPVKTVPAGMMDFVRYEPESREVYAHAPTPKLRNRVLKRDGYRCKLCGASPNSDVHVKLHVHHIRPFSLGGLTREENLITLCHTCHEGLEPHMDLQLFGFNGEIQRFFDDFGAYSASAYNEDVRRYRSWHKRTIEQSDGANS